MKKYTLIFLASALLLSGCQLFSQQQKEGVVAEVDGQLLYEHELKEITSGMNSQDSAQAAAQYIRQWATDILVYQKARHRTDGDIEKMVENYRRNLYVHAFNERLVKQKMSVGVEDTTIREIYEQNKSRFVLRENVLKGLLVVVPNGAPKMDKLRKWMATPNEKNIELIEKYAYQYASGYELFLDQWTTANQLLMWMPFEKEVFVQQLGQKHQLELSDSTSTFILQITSLAKAGDYMPMDYATPQIEEIILSKRQVDFLKQEYDELYEDAVRFKKVKLYEKK